MVNFMRFESCVHYQSSSTRCPITNAPKYSSALSIASLRSVSPCFYRDEDGHRMEAILPFINLDSMKRLRANERILDEDDDIDQSSVYHLKDLECDGALHGERRSNC